MLPVRRDARGYRVRPTQPPKFRRRQGHLLVHMSRSMRELPGLWHHPSVGDLLGAVIRRAAIRPHPGRRGITQERVTRARDRSNSI
jgi:hypothetical protein